ncbi:DNA primase, partial [Mesorhizobium sp. M8A.F.Ca.ET.218.01.1.1]
MFVRLKGSDSGKGAAGKWTDAATGEHGDLLDIIGESIGLADFKDVSDEARGFLSIPSTTSEPNDRWEQSGPVDSGSAEAAARLIS